MSILNYPKLLYKMWVSYEHFTPSLTMMIHLADEYCLSLLRRSVTRSLITFVFFFRTVLYFFDLTLKIDCFVCTQLVFIYYTRDFVWEIEFFEKERVSNNENISHPVSLKVCYTLYNCSNIKLNLILTTGALMKEKSISCFNWSIKSIKSCFIKVKKER